MDENPYYAKLAKVPAYKLRQVMNHLLLNEYLNLTNDEYTIVKLTDSSIRIVEERETVVMKMAKETVASERETNEKKTRKPKMAGVSLPEQDEALFEILRTLRMELSRQEKVPPYIIFSDKTLIHMCVIKPSNKEEMLSVPGIGVHKYEKYGEIFQQCLISHLQNS